MERTFRYDCTDTNIWQHFLRVIPTMHKSIHEAVSDTVGTVTLKCGDGFVYDYAIEACLDMIYSELTMKPGDDYISFEKPSKRELPITPQHFITTSSTHSFPLCAVLSDKGAFPWFYEHFIQITSVRLNTEYKMTIKYSESKKVFDSLFSENIPLNIQPGLKLDSFVGFIKEKIDSGYYIHISMDRYFFLGNTAYRDFHHFHSVGLIYGYDDLTNVFKSVGFNNRENYEKTELRYGDLKRSFEYTSTWFKYRKQMLKMLKLKQEITYKFNINNFLEQLNNFINSTGEPYKIYEKSTENILRYGTDAYEDFYLNLVGFIDGGAFLRYNSFHLFWEHRKGICDRLKYISEIFVLPNDILNLINSYNIVTDECDVVKNMYKKLVRVNKIWLRDTIAARDINNMDFVRRIAEKVYEKNKNEKDVLTKIYSRLITYS